MTLPPLKKRLITDIKLFTGKSSFSLRIVWGNPARVQ
jgi:hypothetical protein